MVFERMISSVGASQQVTTEFSIHSTLYSVKGADKSTTLTSDVEAVTLPISLFHGDYHLLTTPSESQVFFLFQRIWTG